MTNRRSSWNEQEQGTRRTSDRRQASHLNVVLSKAALSGPSVCLRARAPCPLRASCPVTDRESAQLSRSLLEQIIGSRSDRTALRSSPGSCGRAARLQACVPVAPWVKTDTDPPCLVWHGLTRPRGSGVRIANVSALTILQT